MLGFKLNYVSEMGPRQLWIDVLYAQKRSPFE